MRTVHRKVAAALALLWLTGAAGAQAGVGQTTLVSRQSVGDGSANADADSSLPSLSGNGRYVAFVSAADNLSAADDNSVTNIFLRDTLTGTTALVSRRSAVD